MPVNLHEQYERSRAVFRAALAAQPDEAEAAFLAGVTDLVQQLADAGMLREPPPRVAFEDAWGAAMWIIEAAANDRVTLLGPGALLHGEPSYAYAVAKVRERAALLPDGWPGTLRAAIAQLDAHAAAAARGPQDAPQDATGGAAPP